MPYEGGGSVAPPIVGPTKSLALDNWLWPAGQGFGKVFVVPTPDAARVAVRVTWSMNTPDFSRLTVRVRVYGRLLAAGTFDHLIDEWFLYGTDADNSPIAQTNDLARTEVYPCAYTYMRVDLQPYDANYPVADCGGIISILPFGF